MHTIINKIVVFFVGVFINFPFVKSKTKEKEVKTISKLYDDGGFTSYFAQLRFWDGPFYELQKLVPQKGVVVDLGCGEGLLTNYLALKGKKRKLIGIEIDRNRVSRAARGLKNTEFRQGSALTSDIPVCDSILMSHMLHHLPSYDSQIILLKRCKKALKNGGKLVIAEIDRGWTLKYALGWFVDGIVVPILFEGTLVNLNFFHRPKNNWKEILESMNFEVKFKKPLPGRPFPDLLIEAYKVEKD